MRVCADVRNSSDDDEAWACSVPVDGASTLRHLNKDLKPQGFSIASLLPLLAPATASLVLEDVLKGHR
jgi:hypothetical protein